MPTLSAFTPCGMLALSSKPSHGENIYRTAVASLGGNYSVSAGSRMDCTMYAQAMSMAKARYTIERAGNQIDPLKVHELLPVRELEYGITPGPNDTTADRNNTLAARKKLPRGSTLANVTAALSDLVGSDLEAFHPHTWAEHSTYPTSITSAEMNLQLPTVPVKRIKLVDPVMYTGSAQTIRYDALDSGEGTALYEVPPDLVYQVTAVALQVGDKLLVQAGVLGHWEVVTVTAVGINTTSPVKRTFTATFTKAHDVDSVCTTQPFPYWTSTLKHSLVILRSAAAYAVDAEKRRKIDDLLRRIMPVVSTWDICGGISGNTGAFVLDLSFLNNNTIGDVAY